MKLKLPLALGASLLVAASSAFAADATENYAKYCASCHGKDGAGHTKAGRLVKVKDLTDGAYQKSFTDADASKAITDGQTDKDGHVQMKPLKDKLTGDETTALVAYVRTLAK